MPDFEVAVVGDGILGAFVVDALTHDVARASDIGWFGDEASFEEHSATSYSGGLVRCGMRPLQHDDALDAFDAWWRYEPALHRIGALEAVSDATAAYSRAAELRSRGLEALVLRGTQIAEMTGAHYPRVETALYEPEAGYVDVRRLRTELLNHAVNVGVSILHRHHVVLIDDPANTPTATIHTKDGSFTARAVAVVAGAGTKKLLPAWDDLTQLRTIGYGFFSGLLPIGLPTLNDDRFGLWWRPAPTAEHPDRYLVGRARDVGAGGQATAVHSLDQAEYIRDGLLGYLDDAEAGRYLGGVLSFDACTPRPHAPRHLMVSSTGRVVSATNFNGGGLKRAPALAQQITSLIKTERR